MSSNAGDVGGGGIFGAVKRKLTGESITLMEVTGQGPVYVANKAKEINLIELRARRCSSRRGTSSRSTPACRPS